MRVEHACTNDRECNFLTQAPTQIPKPAYEIQLFTAITEAIPNIIIKAPNTNCAMAKPRKDDARYAMITIPRECVGSYILTSWQRFLLSGEGWSIKAINQSINQICSQ